MSEQKQPEKGISLNPLNNSNYFWAFMDSNESNESNRKKLTVPTKTISKPEIKKKIPAQIPCLRCKKCLVDNPAKSDEVHRGYCSKCWYNR